MNEQIIQTILTHTPHVQAVYLFGSYGTEDERPSSDVDIAFLLPHEEAKVAGSLLLGELHLSLADLLGNEVDLVNLRQVSTVFQKEIVMTGQQIFALMRTLLTNLKCSPCLITRSSTKSDAKFWPLLENLVGHTTYD